MMNLKRKAELVATRKTSSNLLLSLSGGKMEGITVITTSCHNNDFCKSMQKCKGTICQYCYADSNLKRKTSADNAYILNGDILSSRLLEGWELAEIRHLLISYCEGYHRFESHGDLINETHMINIISICEYCKDLDINFALWTKRSNTVFPKVRALGYEKPENLQIVASSYYNNIPLDERMLEQWIDTVFTVYTYDFLKDHKEVIINCGVYKCFDCHKCYDKKNGIMKVNEVLKSDSSKYIKWLVSQAKRKGYDFSGMEKEQVLRMSKLILED